MIPTTKIDFRYRSVYESLDITDIACMLFPGNRRQQFAAVRLLLTLKSSTGLVQNLNQLLKEQGLSRRTLERTRAKLTRLGLIERVTWMNRRFGGQSGWRLSGRMPAAFRRLADFLDAWAQDAGAERHQKDLMLAETLRP